MNKRTNTSEQGQEAEDRAATYLLSINHQIIGRNWRTRWCEIDIISQADGTIHIVEVKSRLNPSFGKGYEYITPKKLQKLKNAAAYWVSENNWEGDYQVDVISVDGPNHQLTYIQNVLN